MTSIDTKTPDYVQTKISQSRKARRGAVTQTQWAKEHLARHCELDSVVNLEIRRRLLEQHGNFSLAYSTAVQPLLKHFGDSEGYIAYRQRWGVTFALGDPLTPRNLHESLLDRFTNHFRKTVFCQISKSTAQLLAARGYYINEFGVDTRLMLDQYTLGGKEKEWLRYAWNWVQRRGYQIIEADFDTVCPKEVEFVSEAWRRSRTVKRKEVRFLNRPILLANETDVRKFYLIDPQGQIAAYVFLDPLYQNGQISGYVTAFKRRHPSATQYSEQAIMKAIIDKLKSEEVAELRLGLSPCAWIRDHEFTSSWFTRKLFNTMFGSATVNRWSYNLVGHADYKRRFRGIEEQTYFASKSKYSLWELSALVGLCGIA